MIEFGLTATDEPLSGRARPDAEVPGDDAVVSGIPERRKDDSRDRAAAFDEEWTESSRSKVKVDAVDLSEELRNLSDEDGTTPSPTK
jgi:hypothetical protein